MDEERKLSDADIDAIIDGLEQRVVQRLQTNVGKGVISILTTWAIRVIVLVAVYGAGSGWLKKLAGG
ncbi:MULTISPECIES: hypothetical protein [Burkholderia]|uniref:hypothetical protein n=1 Tax=Burkholderia TaxID=32008 RepID=UPI000BF57226|nr:hypothetical protein [Burkholderia sp. JKS000303]PFH12831.1 hypothetical protein BX604_7251 [Burkholderia sp. JKS000303]